MTNTIQTLPTEPGGTDITRFNALRHGVLSRYTVLPWESADEYRAVVEALVAEHGPQGPTEEHLVEEIAASSGASEGFALLRPPRIDVGWRERWNLTARR